MISIVALYVKIYLVEFLFEKFSVALKTYFHLFAKKLENREIFLILNFLGNEFRSKMNSLRLSTLARIFNHLRYVNWRSNFSLSLSFSESMDFGTDSFEFQLHTADGAFRQRNQWMRIDSFFPLFAVIKLTALYFAQSCELIILVREIAVKLNEIKFLPDIGEQCGENEKHFAENSISVFVVRGKETTNDSFFLFSIDNSFVNLALWLIFWFESCSLENCYGYFQLSIFSINGAIIN